MKIKEPNISTYYHYEKLFKTKEEAINCLKEKRELLKVLLKMYGKKDENIIELNPPNLHDQHRIIMKSIDNVNLIMSKLTHDILVISEFGIED